MHCISNLSAGVRIRPVVITALVIAFCLFSLLGGNVNRSSGPVVMIVMFSFGIKVYVLEIHGVSLKANNCDECISSLIKQLRSSFSCNMSSRRR